MNFDRRNLLKGLATLAGTTALTKSSVTPLHAEPMADRIHLNIVLHGAAALEFDTAQKRVFLRIPTVPGHQYKAGASTSPQLIDPGTIRIDLPGFDNRDLPPELNDKTQADLVVVRKKNSKFQLNPQRPELIIFDLPFPESIKPARSLEFLQSGTFFDDPKSLLQVEPQQVPLCLVLQYTVDESSIPALPGNPGTVMKHRNLHIYAEPAPNAIVVLRLLTNIKALTQHNKDQEFKELSTQIQDLINRNKKFVPLMDVQHPATAFNQVTALYVGLDSLKVSQAALDPLNLVDADVQEPDDLGYGETRSLEELASAIPGPTGTGTGRVIGCAPLVLVN